MFRRQFILAMIGLASTVPFTKLRQFKALVVPKTIGNGIVMRNGWILLDTDE
jgi:hypothetical protein